jgi:chromosome segregation ATPase
VAIVINGSGTITGVSTGGLPDDAEQNMRLDMAEKTVDKLEERVENLDDELQDLKHRRP